jgi:hypothetical protein
MSQSPATSNDLLFARVAKRALTYGAAVVAVLSTALYFVFQTANKAALAPYGLDPSGFSGSTAEMIGGGLGTLLIFFLILFALYWPIGWPVAKISERFSGWYIGKYGKPARLTHLERWIASDPIKRSGRALLVGGTAIAALLTVILLYSGTAIGQWRVSQAEWLVSANNCASGCFAYKQAGRPDLVIGRPIAANSTRLAVVVGHGKAQVVEVAKITAVEARQGPPVTVPATAPWTLRWGWRLLNVLNANW